MRSLVIISLLARALAGTLSSPLLEFTPEDVKTTSTYKISFETESAVSSDYRINVLFPTGIALTPNSNYPCTAKVDFNTPGTYHCEATASELTVFGGFSDVTHSFIVSVELVFQVTNPASS